MGGGSKQEAAAVAGRRRRKKKGRPSLIELQKRSIRLQKQQEEEEEEAARRKRRRPDPEPNPNPYSRFPNSGSGRRATRRNSDPAADDGDDDGGGSRREKKLSSVLRSPELSDSDEGGGRKRRIDSVGSSKTHKLSSPPKASNGGRRETSDSGPGTPLPDKKLLFFILDRLQKKDTYGVYSEPVDPEELPDYLDVIKHPMDFATIRSKLQRGAYKNLEQFEDDVFLISTNAMCYNSPDTIYYRQARAIQELAKKDFENLRRDSDASEPEPEPDPTPVTEQKPRRGRPPRNLAGKQKVGRPPTEQNKSEKSSGPTHANVRTDGRVYYSGLDSSLKGLDKASIPDIFRSSCGVQINENWSNGRMPNRFDVYSGSGMKGASMKFEKKSLAIDETPRDSFNQSLPSTSMLDLTPYFGRRSLVPVGIRMPHPYSHSLARFAADFGPIGWQAAAKRIERALPPGSKFGPGWVEETEAPQTSQQPPMTTITSPQQSMNMKQNLGAMPPGSLVASTTEQASNGISIEPGSSTAFHPRASSLGLNSLSQMSLEGSSTPQIHNEYSLHSTLNGFTSSSVGHIMAQLRKNADAALRSNHGPIYQAIASLPDMERSRIPAGPQNSNVPDSSHDS